MAQPVETTTILNAPWDEHSMTFFKSVADLCFTGPFAVLGKAKYQYRPLRASRKMVQVWERWQTDGQMDATKRIISPSSRSIVVDAGWFLTSRQLWFLWECLESAV